MIKATKQNKKERVYMEQTMREYLRKGEVVCWESKPADFSALDGMTKKSYLIRLLATVLVAGGIIAGHLLSEGETRPGLIVLVIVAAAAVAVSPFWQKRRLMKNIYWITDQRVIMMSTDRVAKSMELQEIDAFKVMADGTAKNCLILGSAAFPEAEKNIRWYALTPKVDDEAGGNKSHAKGLVFYNAERVEEAVQLLKQAGCAKIA